MTNVIFIAYEFPPVNVGGTQRPLKFVKYLRDFGVNPIVFTLSEKSYTKFYRGSNIDNSTLKEVPAEIEVRRIESRDLTRRYSTKLGAFLSIFFRVVGPEAAAWKPALMRELEKVVKQYKPTAIYVTCPPFGMAELGLVIARTYDLPLVLDMRDAWSQWCVAPYSSRIQYMLTKRKEKQFLRKADAVICTSDQTIADFKKLYPSLPSSKFHLIMNGYDGVLPLTELQADFRNKREIVIGYAGSFYYTPESRKQIFSPWWRRKPHHIFQYVPRKEDWLYRSPYFFFQAISILIKDVNLQSRIRIKFAGDVPTWLRDMVKQFGLEECCDFMGRLSHEEVLAFQKSCDALLITSSKVIGGEDYSIAGKTFEYFSMRKPIIAFVTNGAQKRLLEKSGLAAICDPDNMAASVNTLRELFAGKIKLNPEKEFLSALSRKGLTKNLADIIKEVSARR